ncbi:hypothetical protein [Streptomyces sp. NPDC060194]|uniref:hypothetical protein n=1 Tax=Streptomyces sp. NPDC060194 TaxID=3347069 RepID=UPI0036556108
MARVVCEHAGCGKSQTVRRSRLTGCAGYACHPAHLSRSGPAPGTVREEVMHAAGGFWGRRDVPEGGDPLGEHGAPPGTEVVR